MTSRQRLLFPLFFLALLVLYVRPISDPDFWWHLKTGQWIWQNHTIPERDPFSFTTYEGINPAQGQRIKYILTQYWGAQLFFFIAWKFFGAAGVIFLRAGILLISITLIHRFLLKKRVYSPLAAALSAVAGLHMCLFSNDRPQLFSFLFSVIYLFELEAINDGRKRGIFTLPLISLVWANTHSSALMAWLLGVPYLLHALYGFFRKDGKNSKFITATILLSLSFTFLSPNTYHAPSILKGLNESRHFKLNTEFMSPFEQFRESGVLYPAYWLLILLSAVTFFSRGISKRRLIILVALMLISFRSGRFTPFFVLISPMLLGTALQKMFGGLNKRIILFSLSLVFSLFLYTFYNFGGDIFRLGADDNDYPADAAAFVKTRDIRGRMFNFFEWGGYLLWHLPQQKTFIDSRALRLDVWDEYYDTAHNPTAGWTDVLRKYRIDFVFLPLVSPATGEPMAVIYLLLDNAEWKPVYVDKLSIIFLKRESPLEIVPREEVLDQTIISLREWAYKDPQNALRWSRLAAAFYQKGNKKEALRNYKKAYSLKPADPFLENMIRLLEA